MDVSAKQRVTRWMHVVSLAVLMLLGAADGRVGAARCPTVGPPPASGGPSALPPLPAVLRSTTGQPALIVTGHQARVVVIDTSRNQLMMYRQTQRGWVGHIVMGAPLSDLFRADAFTCDASGCWIAAALSGTGNLARIVVLRQLPASSTWTPVWQTAVPSIAAGQMLQLAACGRAVWLLSTGSPGAGLMPDMLWVSVDAGHTWRVLASGDLPKIRAPFIMPSGYPTGMAVVPHIGLVVSLSPRGGETAAVAYGADPLSQHRWSFPVPRPFRAIIEALPAMNGPRLLVVEAAADGSGYLLLVTRSARETGWIIRPLEPLTDNAPQGVSGPETTVVVTRSIQLVSPGRPILTLPVKPGFVSPFVAMVVQANRVVVLSHSGRLWINADTRWRSFPLTNGLIEQMTR